MYTLYYAPGTCSMAIHVILNELGQQVELKKVDLQAPRTPEYLKVNPRGNVPVLVDDGHVIREGGAIISYLLDKHGSAMMPKSGKERATALEWLMFANATMHPAYAKGFFSVKTAKNDEQKKVFFDAALEGINKLWKEVDGQLAKQPYVCGKDVSAADILLTVIANWGGYFPEKPIFGENVKRMLKDVSSRPAFQKALAAEQVEYKAAA